MTPEYDSDTFHENRLPYITPVVRYQSGIHENRLPWITPVVRYQSVIHENKTPDIPSLYGIDIIMCLNHTLVSSEVACFQMRVSL
jgi:hypothetical protein